MKKGLLFLVLFILPFSLFGSDYSESILSYLKGYRSETKGDFEEALNQYKEALKLDPKSSEIRTDMAFLYIKKGEPDRAEELLQKALDLLNRSF